MNDIKNIDILDLYVRKENLQYDKNDLECELETLQFRETTYITKEDFDDAVSPVASTSPRNALGVETYAVPSPSYTTRSL